MANLKYDLESGYVLVSIFTGTKSRGKNIASKYLSHNAEERLNK